MAHIQKLSRGKARWQARYRAPDGKERTQTFTRKVDAQRWLDAQSADVARGAWVDPTLGRITFGEWAVRWEEGLVGLRATTRDRNLGVVRNHLVPCFADWPLTAISTSEVKAMVADQLASGLSPAAVRRHVIVLRGILDAAVAEGRLGRNPCDGVKLPSGDSRPMRFLDPDEVNDLAEAHTEHYRPLIYTASFLGLRWGELAGLHVERVGLLRKTIAVVTQLVEVNGRLAWGPPKTKAGVRTVAIPGSLVAMLGRHFACEPVRASGLAFPTVSGRPMRRSNFRRAWQRALQKVEWTGGHPFAGLVFHELRHTAAALAIDQGAHPLTIRDRLGHSSIKVTMDLYGHRFPAQDQALAEALDRVLRGSLASRAERLRNDGGTLSRLPRSEA